MGEKVFGELMTRVMSAVNTAPTYHEVVEKCSRERHDAEGLTRRKAHLNARTGVVRRFFSGGSHALWFGPPRGRYGGGHGEVRW